MLKTFDKERLILALTFLISILALLGLEWWVRDCGFLLTPDSQNYLSAAKSFQESRLFIGINGNYYTQWPPLFPIILSLFKNPLIAMVWINILCKISLGLGVMFLAHRFLDGLLLKIILFVSVFLCVHTLLISVFLWSEIIFVALYMAHLYVSLNLRNKPAYYYVLIILGVLLCLQRNAGLFFVLSTALWMLLDKTLIINNKKAKTFFYAAICILSLLCWYYYNILFMTGSKPFYERDFFASTFLNIELILSVLGHAALPFSGRISIMIGIVICGVLTFYWYKHLSADNSIMLMVLNIAIYTIGFLPVPNLNIHEMERYFAVILPVFLILILVPLERIITNSNANKVIGILCIVIWLGYCFVRTAKNAVQWREMSCHRVVSNK